MKAPDSLSTTVDSLFAEADTLLAVADSLTAKADSSQAAADSTGLGEADSTARLELISLDDCSFFSNDTLFHREVPFRPTGFTTQETPFRIRFDAWGCVLLLLCLVLAASLVKRLRGSFKELFRSTFFPIPGKKEDVPVDDPLRYSTRLLSLSLLSLAATMLTFTYTQHDVDFYPFPETPYLVFGAILLLWLAYFILKRAMSGFVNWVFFRREKIFTMQRAVTLIYALESILVLVLALVVSYQPIGHAQVLFLSIGTMIFVKLLLLFRTFGIFFRKFYGALHLIVYFCTLEVMPLLVMWRVLGFTECLWEIKF